MSATTTVSSSVQMSESIVELIKALNEFHKNCPKIPKSSKNPFLKSKYADLSTILDIVQPVLNECGLVVFQHPTDEFGLTTIVSHVSGQWMSSNYKMQPLESVIEKGNDKQAAQKAITPQSIGSVITYQRRYALGALLSLNIDDDNDGNPLNGQVADEPTAPAAPKKTAKQLMEEAAAAAKQNGQPATTAASTQAPLIPAIQVTVETPQPLMATTTPADKASTSTQKCSVDQVATAKDLLAKWEQSSPGVTKQFITQFKDSGRQKLDELSGPEIEQLINALTARALDDFFAKSLAKNQVASAA